MLSNAIQSAAAAALAIEEALTPDPAPVPARMPRPITCDCSECYNLACVGRELPEDGSCLWDRLCADRDYRWELVREWEADRDYAIWRCFYRHIHWAEQEAEWEAQAAKEAVISGWLAGEVAA
jgi:hypothetical protein